MFGSWSRPECVEELHQQAQLNLQSLLQGKNGNGGSVWMEGVGVCVGESVRVLWFEWVGKACKQVGMCLCVFSIGWRD